MNVIAPGALLLAGGERLAQGLVVDAVLMIRNVTHSDILVKQRLGISCVRPAGAA
jgi:hypothetical protein